MNLKPEIQGTTHYLVYTTGQEDNIDSMGLGMLTNNKIPGLAETVFTQLDLTKYIKYNISGKIPVAQFFSGQVNKKMLIGVFSGIIDAMLSAEEYMIDTKTILLDLNYIFTDVSTCETVLICVPVIDPEKDAIDLGVFFKQIMFSTQFDQTENCDHVARIINYLNSTPLFSLIDFKNVLNNIANIPQQSISKPEIQDQPVLQNTAAQHSASQTMVFQHSTSNAEVSLRPQPQSVVSQHLSPQPVVSVQSAANSSFSKPSSQPSKFLQMSASQPSVPEASTTKQSPKKPSFFNKLLHHGDNKKKSKSKVPAHAGSKNKVDFAVPGVSAAIPDNHLDQPVNPQSKFNSNPAAPSFVSAEKKLPAQYQVPVSVSPQGQNGNFGETTVLNGSSNGETTILGVEIQQEAFPYLLRMKNQEKIFLNKPVFRVGKERSYVDYFIGDNTAISRSHANFVRRNSEVFVLDTNSTNHTYVNGTMIQSNIEVKISHGDKIRLANEDFIFNIY